MTYTKGPWRQSKNELGYETFDILADGGDIYVHNLGIATVVDPRFSDPDLGTVALDRDTCNANARLIATAPELLETLKELVDLMQGVIDGNYKPDSFTLQPARIVIEKAGE